MTRKQKKMLWRILSAAALMILFSLLPIWGWLRFSLFMIPYLVVGYDILLKAGRGILNRQIFDENFLMALATVGAIILALTGEGDYTEAVAVMLFYQLGELFQSIAVGKSRKSIGALMDIRPELANLERGDSLEEVSPEEVPVGSVIAVRPGERIPLDGVILTGSSELDTSSLTGESLPRSAKEGDAVISGCINLSGLIRIRTSKAFEESTVSKILDLVENASSRKSRSEAFISRFARIYTPAVCIGALALALLPPLVRGLFLGLDPAFGEWIYRALTFLVISCPCALVISIPLTFFACLGGAGRAGILIKGSNYPEVLSRTDTVVFDKTGTLTKGSFSVVGIYPVKESKERLLEYAARAERDSNHPIAKSICRAYAKGGTENAGAEDLREYSGNGVLALVDGIRIGVGNAGLMEQLGIEHPKTEEDGTAIHVSLDGVWAGYLLLRDEIKENSHAAIAALRRAGVERIVMLTGDRPTVARRVALELELDEYHASLLPGDKVERMEELLAKKGRGSLVFVGDGMNDAPVLARADVGIAMGAMGSDAAIEAADVVLMDDDPTKVARSISISRKCISIVHQNVVFAIGIKLLCLLLGALGIANMWLAIFADVGVMVLAVLNAIRALFVKTKS